MSNVIEFHSFTTLGDFLFDLRKDPEAYSKSLYLFRQILHGELEFRILKSDKLSEPYNFKECFENFMAKVSARGGIFLDTISPQVMPRKNNEYKTVIRNIHGELLSSLMCSDKGKINWKFELPFDKANIFTLDELCIVPPFSQLSPPRNIHNELATLDMAASVGCDVREEIGIFIDKFEFCEFKIPTQKIAAKLDSVFDKNGKCVAAGNLAGDIYESDLDDKCNIGFVVVNGKKLMLSDRESYSYDSCFDIYFNYINKLCLDCGVAVSSASILFYVFLLSNCIEFDIDDGVYRSELKGKITLQNIFLNNKLLSVSSRLYSPYPSLNVDVIDFFHKLYFSKADIDNNIKGFSNLEYINTVEGSELYKFIFEKKGNTPRKNIPDGIVANDIISYMVYAGCKDNLQNDDDVCKSFKMCLAAIALQYPRSGDKVEDTLKKFFPKDFVNTDEKSRTIAQRLQRNINQYLVTKKEDILSYRKR